MEMTEVYLFNVSDYVYQPPGTRGGDLPPEYGITVTGVTHNSCDEIGNNHYRYAAKLVHQSGTMSSLQSRYRGVLPSLNMFVLQGADGVSAGRICGIPNLFAFHRITDTRWSEYRIVPFRYVLTSYD